MSFALTCAAEVRAQIRLLARLAPSHRRPERFHEDKSEIAHKLAQVCDMLEGNFDIVPAEPRPSGNPGKPRKAVIVDSKGNVIQVDFKARRRVDTPRRRP